VSIDLLERGARALGDLLDEVVFVGGATLVLWISDPGAPPPRPTRDVDVVVEIISRPALHRFEKRMRAVGFREDVHGGLTCRWRHRDDAELILDAMPTRAELLGFGNRWQAEAVPHAWRRTLPSGAEIRAASPAHLLASKLEAFNGRGRDDMLMSRDLDDIVSLLDGRPELVGEVAAAPANVRGFLSEGFRRLLADADFRDALLGLVRPDDASQRRVADIIVPRMRAVIDAD
jgi:hypothetical protein